MKSQKRNGRLGATAAEVLVAASLLVSVIGFITSLTFRTGKVLQSARHYQIAMHELANQLELLTSLSEHDRNALLKDLKPSEAVSRALPDAKLESEMLSDTDGERLKLSLYWDRGATVGNPISLVAWLDTREATHD